MATFVGNREQLPDVLMRIAPEDWLPRAKGMSDEAIRDVFTRAANFAIAQNPASDPDPVNRKHRILTSALAERDRLFAEAAALA